LDIGNLFFVDYEVGVVRKIIKLTKIVTTVAGNGVRGYSGGGGGYATNAV
jgi:hypothetical protein